MASTRARKARTVSPASGSVALACGRFAGTFLPRYMGHVLVLNASYEPLNVCTVRRAHVLVFKGKAEVIEHLDQPLRSATGSFIRPHVIRLVHYVRVPRASSGRSRGGRCSPATAGAASTAAPRPAG